MQDASHLKLNGSSIVSVNDSDVAVVTLPESSPSGIQVLPSKVFLSEWNTSQTSSSSSSSNQVKLPLEPSGEYNFTVFWGDGTSDFITSWNQTETPSTIILARELMK